MKKYVFLLLTVFFAVLVYPFSKQEKPESGKYKIYSCINVSESPEINGSLNENIWDSIEKSEIKNIWNPEKAKGELQKTFFMACYDETNLYIGIILEEEDMDNLVLKGSSEHDDVSWVEDAVQIFFDTSLQKNSFYQLMANHAGGKFDGKDQDQFWNMKWKSEVKKYKSKWELEISIPFSELTKTGVPEVGDVWGFNITRDKPDIHISWKAISGSFGDPEKFGYLVFCKSPDQKYAQKQVELKLEESEKLKEIKLSSGEKHADSENKDDWSGDFEINRKQKYSGEFSFELSEKHRSILTKDLIKIDKNKRYYISCRMRSLNEEQLASCMFGVHMYDKNMNRILMRNVGVVKKTETKLYSDAEKGSEKIFINPDPDWLNQKNVAAVFEIKQDFNDLPNFNVFNIDSVKPGENKYTVFLLRKINKNYNAGTPVRMHVSWGAPLFKIAQRTEIPAEWMKFTNEMKGISKAGNPMKQFWAGTEYIRIFINFGNAFNKPAKGSVLLVDDIEIISY